MPFKTDHSWTPYAYRRAHAAWAANATANDSDITARQAETEGKPRHTQLSQRLRNLLTWRAMNRGEDWTAIAANDNSDPDDRAPALLDSRLEQRPTQREMLTALKGVEFGEFRQPRLGGGGPIEMVPIGGDIERGRVFGQGRRKVPDCIVRLGSLRFSNGAEEEPALVLEMGKAVRGAVRIELGGLTRWGKQRPQDRFGRAKGAAANDNAPTVGRSEAAGAGAMDFEDPVASAQHAAWVRQALGPDHAAVLDLAIVAANFREIGEHLGYAGKIAERRGKQAVLEACAALDEKLAA